MGRKKEFRLAVHRKNEFRKKYSKQRNYNVEVSPCFVVSVPLDKVKWLETKHPASNPVELPKISIPRSVVEEMQVSNLDCLMQRLQAMPDIIEGILLIVC